MVPARSVHMLLVAAALGGCSDDEVRQDPVDAPVELALPTTSAEPAAAEPKRTQAVARPLVAMNERQIGSALVGVVVDEQRILIAADTDARILHVVLAADHSLLATVPLPGTPAQMVVGGDGRLFVSLRDRARVLGLRLADTGYELIEDTRFDVPAEPIGLAVHGDSLAVASAWDARVTVLSTLGGQTLASVATPRDPRAVAFEDDDTLVVTHGVGGEWSRIHIAAASRDAIGLAQIDVEVREPHSYKLDINIRDVRRDCFRSGFRWDDALQGVACSATSELPKWVLRGAKAKEKIPALRARREAFTAGAPANYHTAHSDLANLKPHSLFHRARTGGQGLALARAGDELVAPAVLTRHHGGWWGEGFTSHQPTLAHIGETNVTLRVESATFRAADARIDAGRQLTLCTLPRAADAYDGQVFVACAGSDLVLAYDADADKTLRRAYRGAMKVSSLPAGVAVDPVDGELHVWSQHEQEIASVPLGRFSPTKSPHPDRAIDATPSFAPTRATSLSSRNTSSGSSAAARRGRLLFHATANRRMSRGGMACASCHPDGRDDMLVWQTRFGPRQTPMLVARLGEDTSPYGWEGDSPTLLHHLGHTFARNGGDHLPEAQLHDLVAYLHAIPSPPAPAVAQDAAKVDRGRELFFSPSVGCATCHVDGVGSDGQIHDAGGGEPLDTPSLRFVGRSAPYFHDGRFDTLQQLLEATASTMGWAKDMTDDDRGALIAYLETL